MFYDTQDVFGMMNLHGSKSIPFLFGIDFEKQNGFFCKVCDAEKSGIKYSIGNSICDSRPCINPSKFFLKKYPVNFLDYNSAFQKVQNSIFEGKSYLTNLTFSTPIEIGISLEEVFKMCHEKYTVWLKDYFLFFSPETFVKTSGNKIYSFPMKGTIDAEIENAEGKILLDLKEKAEHATITDLIRNDLSMVSNNVTVECYRYIEKIQTNTKPLLQVSSKISGELCSDWRSNIGSIFDCLLPAGSISGAPKNSTINIIKAVETVPRGFYTGVFGLFDGKDLDSCVMIRFIEQKEGKLFFHSGGGITSMSHPKTEYQEMIDKIYVPFN